MKPSSQRISAVRTAVDFIQAQIGQGIWRTGDRLSTIDDLCEKAGVSYVSMWKAVNILADQKVLHVKRRTGIYVGKPPARPRDRQQPRVQSIAQRLLIDVLEGRFHNSRELPTRKELTALYETSSRTMRAALDGLTSEGHLAPLGRGFRVERKKFASASTPTILLLIGPDFPARCEASYWRSTSEQFLHYFEQQCARRNMRIDWMTVSDGFHLPESRIKGLFGAVMVVTGYLPRSAYDIAVPLARQRKPFIIFDHSFPGFSVQLPPVPGTRVFRMGNAESGRLVANALLHLGHREVCFVCDKREEWSQQRHDGIASAFAKAGYPEAVHWFSADDFADRDSRTARADADCLLVDSLRKKVIGSSLGQPYKGRLTARLEEAWYWRYIYRRMEPAMKRALECAGATAWIAGDDYGGLYAVLPFLRSRKICIPGDMSVVSFNNQFESAYSALTSYQFDMTGMAMRLLSLLLYPDLDRRLHGRQEPAAVEEIGGFIVDRGSMGVPPPRSDF